MKEDKKLSKDYIFYIGSYKQVADFETTNEYIVNHIKKAYLYGDNISKLLRTLKKINTDQYNLRLQMSTAI